MGEKLFIYLWFFGGFVLAFACLLIATFARSIKVLKWLCFAGAFSGLVYQGGCFAVASGVGHATGGGGSDSTLNTILVIGIFVAVIWGILILSWPSADQIGEPQKKKQDADAT